MRVETFTLTRDELFNLLTEAYRNGYATCEMVDAGLEPYEPDVYARWIMLKLETKPNEATN